MHTRNASDNSEKNGNSHANTESSHLPSESIPGCLMAALIETAMIIIASGTATKGLKSIIETTPEAVIMSNRSPPTMSIPQKTPSTIIA